MLDSQGYLKLVDFGLAKDLMDGSKTFTVVGTVPRGGGAPPEWLGCEAVGYGSGGSSGG